MVRRKGQRFEYYIKDDEVAYHFILTKKSHEELKQAQGQAERTPEKREVDQGAIQLQLLASEQKQ